MSMQWISAERVRALLDKAGRVQIQNTLMRMPDKVAAVNLQSLEEEERERVFDCLPRAKVERIRSEIVYLRRLAMTREVAEEMMRAFEAAFAGGAGKKIRPYIRAKKRDR